MVAYPIETVLAEKIVTMIDRGDERFVRRHDLGADLPDNYGEAIAMVAEFADPLLSGAVTSGHWDPLRRTWPT